jgi:leucyl/phenylalanyl-tRNA--protein transferase
MTRARRTTRSLFWLARDAEPTAFPHPDEALTEPNGLLAAGGDLTPERLLAAYSRGIFPWYEEGQPILWWSPDPRAVLWPADLKVSRSLRRSRDKSGFDFRVDTAFASVIRECAEPRHYGGGTWITADVAAAYVRLHELGWAHSFETWRDGVLVGGLYGVAIGRVFFGESMFARVSDASKVALVRGVELLRERNFALIDCQVASSHLASLGAVTLPRREFLGLLTDLCSPAGEPRSWRLPTI